MSPPLRWLFADQLGPAFDDGGEMVLIVSRRAFARRRMHRAKALIYLSAMLHRATHERVRLVMADTYREGLAEAAPDGSGSVEVIEPTSRPARALVRDLGVAVLPGRGFVTSQEEFAIWAEGRSRLLLEDYYRDVRRRTGILMTPTGEPEGGRWNFDADNRLPPPKAPDLGLHTWFPESDEVDAQARELLTRWQDQGWLTLRGVDGPRSFAVTRQEALAALDDFITHRLRLFGPYEDATLAGDWVMALSLLSVPLNLGLLHPGEVIDAVVEAHLADPVAAPLTGVEGFVRQVLGWREYVWHLYWWFGPDYATHNALSAEVDPPAWFDEARSDDVDAACLRHALAQTRDRGWSHHIVRLMVLANWALQRGYRPQAVNEWFVDMFVDGTAWVMPANVIGMGLFADGGQMATKPYAAGGAYLNRMTDFCRDCRYSPTVRVGPTACPFTAGYWWFLDRNEAALAGNHRLRNPYGTMRRLTDLAALVDQESGRAGPP
ncbi:MAG: photolyase [Actinomycetota bacterium]|nr:photolyase [Actinomycetota bacterium]